LPRDYHGFDSRFKVNRFFEFFVNIYSGLRKTLEIKGFAAVCAQNKRDSSEITLFFKK